MKIIRPLEISPQEFYDKLIEDLLKKVKDDTKKEISKDDLHNGYTFSKVSTANYDAETTTIVELIPNQKVHTIIKTPTDLIDSTYEVVEHKKGCEVTYNQSIQSEEKKKRNKLTKGFSHAIYLSRMANTLYHIQSRVLKDKGIE